MAKLATMGLSEEQAVAVASMLTEVEEATAAQAEAAAEISRAKARARVQKWRDAHPSNVTERNVTLQSVTKRLVGEGAPVEDKSLTTEIEPQESKNSAPASPSPREHLETVLDAEHAEGVLQHRKSIKAPLTQRSAKLLAKELGKCPDPNAAADTMMLRGWRGFEASWLANPPQRAGPVSRPNPALDAAKALMDQLDAVTPSETQGHPAYPRLVALPGR